MTLHKTVEHCIGDALAAHHRDIEAIQLTIGVPEAVAIQFETETKAFVVGIRPQKAARGSADQWRFSKL